MTVIPRIKDFPQNVASGQRCYPFFPAEVVTLQKSLITVKEFLKGNTEFPAFRKGKGTYYATKVILENNNSDVRDCFEMYKSFHPVPSKLRQGQSNPKDRFLRMLSVWTEVGAISISNYRIHFEPILLMRLK